MPSARWQTKKQRDRAGPFAAKVPPVKRQWCSVKPPKPVRFNARDGYVGAVLAGARAMPVRRPSEQWAPA